MMHTTCVLLACALAVGCGKQAAESKDKPAPAPATNTDVKPAAKPAPDPACAAKVKEFEPWLVGLQVESSSYEIEMGLKLPVIDRAPMPVDQKVDAVTITTAGGIDAYDVSEHNHAGSKLDDKAPQKAVIEHMTKLREMVAGKDEFEPGPDDRVRIDVDEKATWGDVARAVEAATKAGYKEAVFAFTATSKLTPPAGAEPWTTTREAHDAASTALAALQKKCSAWGSAMMRHVPKKSRSENARAVASEIAAALVECNCAATVDEVRSAMWKDTRWHQARPRVGVTIQLAADGKPISMPKATPWGTAHTKLLDVVPEGSTTAVKLVAK